MEKKTLAPEMVAALKAPLPAGAIKQHPTRKYLSTIKPAFVIERLNDVFGMAGWFADSRIVETGPMIVAETTLSIPEYGISKTSFGGNDNDDRGDAYKGACTDGLTKCASYLGIGLEVYKGHDDAGAVGPAPKRPKPSTAPTTEPRAKGSQPTALTTGSAGDFLDINISEVRMAHYKDAEARKKAGKPDQFLWAVDGNKSWPCFTPDLYETLKGLQGENVRVQLKSNAVIAVWAKSGPDLEVSDADIPF